MPFKFKFMIDDNTQFECILESNRCEGIKPNGQRCKRTCVNGLPFCAAHLKSNLKLQIKPSTIPNGGKGLFATSVPYNGNQVVFKKNETIVGYNGEIINDNELVHRYGQNTAPYALKVKNDTHIDCACSRGVGSFANHNNMRIVNARFSVNYRQNSVSLKAIKDIKNGAEIFVHYGELFNLNERPKHSTVATRRV